jgi:hypothetical protein
MSLVTGERRFANDAAIFEADIAALRFAFTLDRGGDVRSGFLDFHHRATRAIRRNRIGLLDRIPPERLEEIVLRWGALYRRCYAHLLARHARDVPAPAPRDAVADPRLRLTERGISCLSIASRYAEFWAEGATLHDEAFAEWDARLSYVGTAEFDRLHALRENEDLLAYDGRGLALPVFDLARSAREAGERPLWAHFLDSGIRLARLSETAERAFAAIAGRGPVHPGEARPMRAQARPDRRTGLSPILFRARTGILARGYHHAPTGAWLIAGEDPDAAFFTMQSLRAEAEFCRLVVPRALARAAAAVFPNQSLRPVRSDPEAYETIMLDAIEAHQGPVAARRDHLCLDDWYFRGEDHSFRATGNVVASAPEDMGGARLSSHAQPR